MVKLVTVFLAVLLACYPVAAEETPWEEYKASMISHDGRVIDRAANNISHSEGQAFAMLLAVGFDDRDLFDRIWRWTKANLGVRDDGLFAWKWGLRVNGNWNVIDYNNASDGDILMAYALLLASDRWGGPEYAIEGLEIVRSIRKHLAVERQGQVFILPGYKGFVEEEGIVINPSYLVSPAFRRFAKADDKRFWEKAYKGSVTLSSEKCFGQWCLPADWVLLKESGPRLYAEKSGRFGYEAIRCLIYLSMEEAKMAPGVEKLLDAYEKLGFLPAWVDLDNDTISLDDAPAGHYAAFSLAARKLGRKGLAAKLMNRAGEKLPGSGYYSFSLYLLASRSESVFK